jgi:hypothetical protein
MFRVFFISASLVGLTLVLGLAPATFAEEVPDTTNIGFVLYTKSHAPGTLNARWMFTDQYNKFKQGATCLGSSSLADH